MRIVYALKGSTEGEIKDLRRGNIRTAHSTHPLETSRLPQRPLEFTYAECTQRTPPDVLFVFWAGMSTHDETSEGAAGTTLRGQRGNLFVFLGRVLLVRDGGDSCLSHSTQTFCDL